MWLTWDLLSTKKRNLLTLYTLTSVCIFSILLTIHSLWYWKGEFVQQSWNSSVDGHFLYSYNLNVWFRVDTVRRNEMLVTYMGKRVNWCEGKKFLSVFKLLSCFTWSHLSCYALTKQTITNKSLRMNPNCLDLEIRIVVYCQQPTKICQFDELADSLTKISV